MMTKEIVVTQTGTFLQKTERVPCNAEVAEAIFAAAAKEFHFLSPNLGFNNHPLFSGAWYFGTKDGGLIALRIKKLLWNGKWKVAPSGDTIAPDPINGDVQVTGEEPDSVFGIEVPESIRLFLVMPEYMTGHFYMLGFGKTPSGVPCWARLPLPNVFDDGDLCTGHLPDPPENIPLMEQATMVADAWARNPWNKDLSRNATIQFLSAVGSKMLPDVTPVVADGAEWASYFQNVNPSNRLIQRLLKPLYERVERRAFEEEEGQQ